MFAQGAHRVCFPLLRVVLSPGLLNNQYSCYEFNTVEAESMERVGPKIVGGGDPLGSSGEWLKTEDLLVPSPSPPSVELEEEFGREKVQSAVSLSFFNSRIN